MEYSEEDKRVLIYNITTLINDSDIRHHNIWLGTRETETPTVGKDGKKWANHEYTGEVAINIVLSNWGV